MRDVFETNTFGVMAMTQAVLAQFRTRRAGVVVHVTSSVTLARMAGLIAEAHAPFAEKVFAGFANPSAVTAESDVAQSVWRAATDVTGQLRFPAGADAVALARTRSISSRPRMSDCFRRQKQTLKEP